MTIAREEIFGPVLSVMRVKTLDDAIELVNQLALRQRDRRSSPASGKVGARIFVARAKWGWWA